MEKLSKFDNKILNNKTTRTTLKNLESQTMKDFDIQNVGIN